MDGFEEFVRFARGLRERFPGLEGGGGASPTRGGHPRAFGTMRCVFDVLHKGKWYRIDAERPQSEYYRLVPREVCDIATNSIMDAVDDWPCTVGYTDDPAPYYEKALKKSFEDVELVESRFKPGIVY